MFHMEHGHCVGVAGCRPLFVARRGQKRVACTKYRAPILPVTKGWKMKARLILSLAVCLFAVGCTDASNPAPANNSTAAQRSTSNPADARAAAAFGGPAPGSGPGLVGPGPR